MIDPDKDVAAQLESVAKLLSAIDERLRNVEIEMAEIRGHHLGFTKFKDWFLVAYGLTATIVAIITNL